MTLGIKSRKAGATKVASSKASAHHGHGHKARQVPGAPSLSRKPSRGTDAPSSSRKSAHGTDAIRYDDLVGKYRTEFTSAEGLKCGAFSLEISTRQQLDGLTLEPGTFGELFRGPTSRAWHRKMGWTGRKYAQEFHDEQLTLILYVWGRQHGKNLQLGLVLESAFTYLLPIPELDGEQVPPEDAATEKVWIHNDNAVFIRNLPCNHFSGITILEPPTTPPTA